MAVNNQNQGLSEDTKTIITVLLLILAFPIGVIMMWVWMRWPKWVKILVTLLLILPFLFVIGIISSVVLIAINPVETTKQARDAARLQDLTTVQEAINKVTKESSSPNLLCNGNTGSCVGDTADNNPRVKNADGTGWVKVNLISLSSLPLDPINDSTYSYTYCSDGKDWEVQARLESKKVLEKAAQDGGDEDDQYEVGTNLAICQLFYQE